MGIVYIIKLQILCTKDSRMRLKLPQRSIIALGYSGEGL